MLIRAVDLVALLNSVMEANKDPDIGFEDANRTYERMVSALNFNITVPIDVIESALWSANLLNEKGKFTHLRDKSFDMMVSDITPKDLIFSRDYNHFKEKRKHNV